MTDIGAEWNDWLALNGGRLMMFARQQTRSEADAEDVLQSALVRTWKTHCGVPTQETVALAYTNVRRCAIDLSRSTLRRRNREEKVLLEAGEPVAWFELPDDDESRALQVAVASLPDIYREVITLKIWGELTFAQIGETLGIPLNTAASRYRYALETLRSRVQQDLEV
ncbi:MAG: RNA polymerase sigma factor [Verrucomicrobiales bacterium]